MSIRTGPLGNGRRWPGLMNPVFFYITWMSLTWGTHGTRMHYGKKASRRRQCPALDNVLQGNLGSCRPCGCYFDTRIMRRATKQKWFRNGLMTTTTSLRSWLDLLIPQISIQSSIYGMCWTNKSHPWRPRLTTYRT
ncbi:hypothetical protein QTP86_028167 [Hemibagrus guttatus]|nr:hypothetical protein QTP86_028167 [Hemibagrus guttatus]